MPKKLLIITGPQGSGNHIFSRLLSLHTTHYLKWASKILDFPIAYENPDIMKFITDDANHKYVQYIDNHWLDRVILAGSEPGRNRRLEFR